MLHYKPDFRQNFIRPNNLILQIIVGCCFGIGLGVVAVRFSPLLVLGAFTALFFLYALLKSPALALLGILIATSSILFEDQLPMISAGISLHIPDLLLLGSLGLIVVRQMVEPQFKIVHTPLDLPLIIFFSLTMLSTILAILQSSAEPESARRWMRILSYYLTFFVVTNLIRERRQLYLLLNGIFFLATIVAGAMAMQFLLGNAVQILPGRIETLNTQGNLYEGITRILPPGWSIVLVSFVTFLCLLGLEKSRRFQWLKFFQCGLFGLALLVTFLRSYWAVLIIIFALLGYLLRGVDRQRLIGWCLVFVSLTAIILLLVFADPNSQVARLVSASIDRLNTLANNGTFQGQDSSLNWRMIENSYAISTIMSNPWLGLGMDFTYRPWDRRLDLNTDPSSYDFRKHIHNGHYWILLQSGLLGYLSFLWLSLTFLIRGLRHWRTVTDARLRGSVLGFTLVYLGVLIAAAVNSTFMQWRWTPVIGIIMGINEVVLMKFRQEESTV